MVSVLNIQINPKNGDKKENLAKIENFMSKCSKQLDLVIMPEFFSTGISHEQFEKYPENENGGEVIDYFKKLAVKYNTNIVAGTVIEKQDNKYYNTSFAIISPFLFIAKLVL